MANKKWGVYIIVIVILAMLVSASVFAVIGRQNGTSGGTTPVMNNTTNTSGNYTRGLAEMYVYIPGGDPNDTRTAVLGDGSQLYYTRSGSHFNLTYNVPINVSISIVNHMDKEMMYSLYANQFRTDYKNNTIQQNVMRHLALGPVGKNETLTTWFLAMPVLINNQTVFDWDPGNSTPIGFDLMDYSGKVETSLLNSTSINCLFTNP